MDWGAIYDDNDREFKLHNDHVGGALEKGYLLPPFGCRLVMKKHFANSTGNSAAAVNTAMFLHNRQRLSRDRRIKINDKE